MTWFSRSRPTRSVQTASAPSPRAADTPDVADRVTLDMASTVLFALEACDPHRTLAGHCARVAARAATLAAACGVDAAHAGVLACAARLHEVGRIGLDAPAAPGLQDARLDHLRSHASIGAQIVRCTRGELAGWLVEHQYTDYEALLRTTPAGGGTRLLLAGILRVADVADILEPRSTEADAGREWARVVLVGGRATRFHPAAVDAWSALDRAPGRDA